MVASTAVFVLVLRGDERRGAVSSLHPPNPSFMSSLLLPPPTSPPRTHRSSAVRVASDHSARIILFLQVGRAILKQVKGAVRQGAS